jgi:outer membrane lipoprotein LolB
MQCCRKPWNVSYNSQEAITALKTGWHTALHDYHAPMRAFITNSFSLVLLAAVLLLGACTSLPELPITAESHEAWASRQVQLAEIDSWKIHARAAIFVDREVHQVGINWQREQEQFAFVIEAPFGQGVFRVETNPSLGDQASTRLTMPDGNVYFDDSAESLLKRLLGWSIPVRRLEWWIRGLPQPLADYSFELRYDGRLKSLQQDGWSVNYLKYFEFDSSAGGLPKKMYLKHQNLALKIVIDRWYPLETQVEPATLFPEFD